MTTINLQWSVQVHPSWHQIRSQLPGTSLPATRSNKTTLLLKCAKLLLKRMQLQRRLARHSNHVQMVSPDSSPVSEQGPNCRLSPQEAFASDQSHEDSMVRLSDGTWLCTVTKVAERMGMYREDSNFINRHMSGYKTVPHLVNEWNSGTGVSSFRAESYLFSREDFIKRTRRFVHISCMTFRCDFYAAVTLLSLSALLPSDFLSSTTIESIVYWLDEILLLFDCLNTGFLSLCRKRSSGDTPIHLPPDISYLCLWLSNGA